MIASAAKIRVVLLDDHPIALAGLRVGLECLPDVEIEGEALDGPEGLQLIAETQPHVAVVDVLLPSVDGFELAAEIRAISPATRVILTTEEPIAIGRSRATQLGVYGFFDKAESLDDLESLIRSAARGEARLEKLAFPDRGDITRLNVREREALAYIATGATLKQLASLMGLTYKSADHIKQQIMKKLDIHDRVELSRLAMRERLIA